MYVINTKGEITMKYVSPIYEVEVIPSEDIMNDPSMMADKLGITLSGDMATIKQNVKIELTDENGSTENVDQNPENTTASGVSISMNFGSLFN